MSYKIIYPDELYHYGVRGMKWGVRKQVQTSSSGRRAQNDPGIIPDKYLTGGGLIGKRRTALRNAGYQRYSKNHNLISATKKAHAEHKAYKQETKRLVKKQSSARTKVKTYLERYGNEPVTIYGVTGTAKTTRKKMNRGRYPAGGLF